MKLLLAITTTDKESLAVELASEAVQRELAACVQIVGPIKSVYRWKGEIESSAEFRCEMKTSSDHFPMLRAMIEELHSYDVPEIVTLPIEDVSDAYRVWLVDQLANRQD